MNEKDKFYSDAA